MVGVANCYKKLHRICDNKVHKLERAAMLMPQDPRKSKGWGRERVLAKESFQIEFSNQRHDCDPLLCLDNLINIEAHLYKCILDVLFS